MLLVSRIFPPNRPRSPCPRLGTDFFNLFFFIRNIAGLSGAFFFSFGFHIVFLQLDFWQKNEDELKVKMMFRDVTVEMHVCFVT